jgi:hypothetical protein
MRRRIRMTLLYLAIAPKLLILKPIISITEIESAIEK